MNSWTTQEKVVHRKFSSENTSEIETLLQHWKFSAQEIWLCEHFSGGNIITTLENLVHRKFGSENASEVETLLHSYKTEKCSEQEI